MDMSDNGPAAKAEEEGFHWDGLPQLAVQKIVSILDKPCEEEALKSLSSTCKRNNALVCKSALHGAAWRNEAVHHFNSLLSKVDGPQCMRRIFEKFTNLTILDVVVTDALFDIEPAKPDNVLRESDLVAFLCKCSVYLQQLRKIVIRMGPISGGCFTAVACNCPNLESLDVPFVHAVHHSGNSGLVLQAFGAFRKVQLGLKWCLQAAAGIASRVSGIAPIKKMS